MEKGSAGLISPYHSMDREYTRYVTVQYQNIRGVNGMAENDRVKKPEEVLAALMQKIPPIYHHLIPEKLTVEQKIQYINDQQKRGLYRLEPYFMWLDRPAGSGLYTGAGTAPGTGPGTGTYLSGPKTKPPVKTINTTKNQPPVNDQKENTIK